MLICKRVYYSGHVQGVGFRYTTQSVAQGFKVSGYVRNLDNGDVELVAEGDTEDVTAFLAAVGRRMGHYIGSTRVEDLEPGGFKDFVIRH